MSRVPGSYSDDTPTTAAATSAATGRWWLPGWKSLAGPLRTAWRRLANWPAFGRFRQLVGGPGPLAKARTRAASYLLHRIESAAPARDPDAAAPADDGPAAGAAAVATRLVEWARTYEAAQLTCVVPALREAGAAGAVAGAILPRDEPSPAGAEPTAPALTIAARPPAPVLGLGTLRLPALEPLGVPDNADAADDRAGRGLHVGSLSTAESP